MGKNNVTPAENPHLPGSRGEITKIHHFITDPSRQSDYCNTQRRGNNGETGRAPVPADKVFWNVEYPEYAPLRNCDKPHREGKSDTHYPQTPADLTEEDRTMWTAIGGTFDESGVPRSPFRTGIEGRGECPGIGPVSCVDPVVFRENPKSGEVEILLIVRADNNSLALPGGKREPIVKEGRRIGWESVYETLKKELIEETGLDLTGIPEERWLSIYEHDLVIAGDARGTDNALFVTTPKIIMLTDKEAKQPLKAEDPKEITAVKWVSATPENIGNLFSTHFDYVQRGRTKLEELGLTTTQRTVRTAINSLI